MVPHPPRKARRPLPREGGNRRGQGWLRFYSRSRDLYRVPSIDKPCWLSVATYPMPLTQLPPDAIYFGPSMTADGLGWRKAYATAWRAILPGDQVTVPADDPLVLDYAAFSGGRN